MSHYWKARFGPIEVGRVTFLNLSKPFFASVNAVSINLECNVNQLPPSTFYKGFDNLADAQAFAVSFFPVDAQPFIQWTEFQ